MYLIKQIEQKSNILKSIWINDKENQNQYRFSSPLSDLKLQLNENYKNEANILNISVVYCSKDK